jgi:hypothetical protein
MEPADRLSPPGRSRLLLLATRKRDQNRALLDPWTAVHLATGLALGLVGSPVRPVLAVSVAYEFAEQVFERLPVGRSLFRSHGPERLPNALVDLAALLTGHWLGTRWNQT